MSTALATNEIDTAEIAARIKSSRESLGISVRAAAAEAEMRFQHWFAIENGQRSASIQMLTKMAAVVGLEISLDLKIRRLSRRKNS